MLIILRLRFYLSPLIVGLSTAVPSSPSRSLDPLEVFFIFFVGEVQAVQDGTNRRVAAIIRVGRGFCGFVYYLFMRTNEVEM